MLVFMNKSTCIDVIKLAVLSKPVLKNTLPKGNSFCLEKNKQETSQLCSSVETVINMCKICFTNMGNKNILSQCIFTISRNS